MKTNRSRIIRLQQKKYVVYVLICPVDRVIKYIGCTKNPLNRLGAHISDKHSNKKKVAWIDGLKRAGLLPLLEIVDQFDDAETAFRREEELIISHYGSVYNVMRKRIPFTEKSGNNKVAQINLRISKEKKDNFTKLVRSFGMSVTGVLERHLDSLLLDEA